MNPSNSQGRGNKVSSTSTKKTGTVRIQPRKTGSALKTSEKKQCPNMPGRGKTRAGKEDNEGVGDVLVLGLWTWTQSLPPL